MRIEAATASVFESRGDTMGRAIPLAAALLLCASVAPTGATAAEIKLLSPGAVSTSLSELMPQFEQSSGHKVTVGYSPALALVDRLKKGEAPDVAIVGDSAADELTKLGLFVTGSKVVIARVGVGVFVRRGDPKPDISTPEAFLRSVMNAKAISYSDPKMGGTAANYVARLMADLDITGSIGPKTKLTAPSKPLRDFVAGGGADFGLNQITEIVADPRLELVGPLPAAYQYYTLYAAGVMAKSQHQDVGKALITFLASPAAAAVMRSKGFEQL
jgi:molybdate transport system substrate-binding protein